MLHCNMHDFSDQLVLEDVLAALWHARRAGDVGRLAHLSCDEVHRSARARGDHLLAARARTLLTGCPFPSRDEFMFAVDRLIAEVEQAHAQLVWQSRSLARGPAATGEEASAR